MVFKLAPAAPLAPFVEFLWAHARDALPHARERILPNGRASLVIAVRQEHILRYDSVDDRQGCRFAGGVLQGSRDRFFLRDTSQPSSVVGVHFRAGGAAALLGLPMTELTNASVPPEALWGARVLSLRDRLRDLPTPAQRLGCLHEWLLALLERRAHRAAIEPAVRWALQCFDSRPTMAVVGSVRASTGWSTQRFLREFCFAVGMTPKHYCRVRRFDAVIRQLAHGRHVEWAQVALDGGYSDQSHLIREFREFAGFTPGSYRAVAADQPSHAFEPPKKSSIQGHGKALR